MPKKTFKIIFALSLVVLPAAVHGGRRLTHVETRKHTDGTFTDIDYKAELADSLIQLHESNATVKTECSDGYLVLTMESHTAATAALKWKSGSIITGGNKHRCNGNPIFRRLVSSAMHGDLDTVRIVTKEAAFVDCFKHADVYIRSIPPHPNNSTAQDPHHEERRRLQNKHARQQQQQQQQRVRKLGLGNYDDTWQDDRTIAELTWNYKKRSR